MRTLIIQPKTKEQLAAMKAVLKALKMDFTIQKKMSEIDSVLANPAMLKRSNETI